MIETSHSHEEDALQRLNKQFEQSVLGPESRVPQPEDTYRVKIRPESPEETALKQAGYSDEKIQDGKFERQELQQAGYFFVNTLGGGEKGIMSGLVTDPDNPAHTVDLTGRTLLTREEIDLIYRHQQVHPDDYGLRGQDLGEVRKDMFAFMRQASHTPRFPHVHAFVKEFIPHPEEGISNATKMYTDATPEDLVTTVDYLSRKAQELQEDNPDLSELRAYNEASIEFLDTHCQDLKNWPDEDFGPFNIKTVRGHTTKSIASRRRRLAGQPSPFLDSGFVYAENPDAEVYMNLPGGKSGLRRLNMGSLHVFGGHPDYPGLSEMGGIQSDQIYMPMGLYIDQLLPKDDQAREAVQAQLYALHAADSTPIEEIGAAVQTRLIEVAKQDAELLAASGPEMPATNDSLAVLRNSIGDFVQAHGPAITFPEGTHMVGHPEAHRPLIASDEQVPVVSLIFSKSFLERIAPEAAKKLCIHEFGLVKVTPTYEYTGSGSVPERLEDISLWDVRDTDWDNGGSGFYIVRPPTDSLEGTSYYLPPSGRFYRQSEPREDKPWPLPSEDPSYISECERQNVSAILDALEQLSEEELRAAMQINV